MWLEFEPEHPPNAQKGAEARRLLQAQRRRDSRPGSPKCLVRTNSRGLEAPAKRLSTGPQGAGGGAPAPTSEANQKGGGHAFHPPETALPRITLITVFQIFL